MVFVPLVFYVQKPQSTRDNNYPRTPADAKVRPADSAGVHARGCDAARERHMRARRRYKSN
jgi:hypothetical protein